MRTPNSIETVEVAVDDDHGRPCLTVYMTPAAAADPETAHSIIARHCEVDRAWQWEAYRTDSLDWVSSSEL